MTSSTYERTLANGLELIVHPTSAPVVSVHVWVDVGRIDERPAEAGWCHFLEHMLFKGTKTRSTAQIAGAVEGAGGEMNAFTSFEYTAYHITLSNKQWKLANSVLSDMVLGSVFKPAEFTPEKEVILEEIKRGEDSPERQLYQGMYGMLWGKKGYGSPVIGFPRTVKACTAASLKSFWKRWYSPGLMTVVICGDVNVAEVVAEAEKTWGRAKGTAPRARRRMTGFKSSYAPLTKMRQSKEFPVQSIRWVGAYPSVSLTDPSLPALDLASSILGQGEASRLFQSLYRDRQLVTSVGCGVWAPFANGMFSFDVETSTEKGAAFLPALHGEIKQFCAEGPTAEEMDRAKTALESERIYGSQTVDNLAHRLGYLKVCAGNTQFDLQYLSQVRDLSAEDVRSACAQVIASGPMAERALFPKGYEEKKFWTGAAVTAAPQSKVKSKKPVTVTKAAPRMVKLPNGIELVLIRRDDSPVVNMQAVMMGGLRAETPKTAGLGSLVAELWDKAPRGWTPEHTARFLESRASRISAFSGKNSTGMSAVMLTKNVDDILPVFADILFSPALDEKEFTRERQVRLEDLKTFEDSPGRVVDRLYCETMFEDHPYSWPVMGRSEAVETLTSTHVRDHYKKLAENARVVIAVAGKFNEDRMLRYFEGLSRKGSESKFSQKLPLTMPRGPRFAEVRKDREQSHIIHGHPGLTIGHERRADLKVLSTLLGGQSGRLFSELRDKQGLCYVVSPMNFEGIEGGSYGVYIGCDPTKRDRALEGIRRELDKLVEKPISEKEVLRAKEFVLGRHHMELQMNSSLASVACLNALYGLGYDEHLRLAEQLKTVSSASLKRLCRELFSQPPVTAIVV